MENCIIFHDLAWGGIYNYIQGVYKLSTMYKKVILIIKPHIETGNGDDGINYIKKEYEQVFKTVDNITYIEYDLKWNYGNITLNIKKYLESFQNYKIYWTLVTSYNPHLKYIDFMEYGYKVFNLPYEIRYDIKFKFYDDKKSLDIFKLFLEETGIKKFIFFSLTCSNNKTFQNEEFNRIIKDNEDTFVLNIHKNLYTENSKFYKQSLCAHRFLNKYLKYDFGFLKCILLLKYFLLEAETLYLSDSNIWSVASVLDINSKIYLYSRYKIGWDKYTKNKIVEKNLF